MSKRNQDDQLQFWNFDRLEETSSRIPSATALPTDRFEQGSLFDLPSTPVPSKKQLNADFADQRPLNILVADDNEINRKVIRVILEKLGYECSEAENGEEALEKYHSGRFDYIFMDLDMPEMDGVEATLKIRSIEELKSKTQAQAEIIAVTANVSDETRLSCRRAGMNGYLEKPITARMIKEQLLRSWPRIRARRAQNSNTKA